MSQPIPYGRTATGRCLLCGQHANVEAVLNEAEDVLDVLVNLIPDIGKLSKVQALQKTLAQLKEAP